MDANERNIGSCHRFQGRVCSKKGEHIFVIKNKEGGGSRVCKGSVEKGVYLTIKITIVLDMVYTRRQKPTELAQECIECKNSIQ